MANQSANRCILEGVPRVGFYAGGALCPEDIMVPSVMRALLDYLGDADYGCKHRASTGSKARVQCTYALFVGISGAGSYISWKDGWYGDNVSLNYLDAEPGMGAARISQAAGYAYELVPRATDGSNELEMRERIIASIQRGMPVVAYGVVGPPEACIITGYDDAGKVLVGWSFFQDETTECEASGYFRKRDWYLETERVLILGEKGEKPSLAATCSEALRWMIQVTRTPAVRTEPDAPECYRDRHNGLAAYDAWRAHLLNDEAWPANDEAMLRAHHEIHNMAVGALAEARWYGSLFLAQETEGFVAGPNRRGTQTEILHAAACYAAEHDLMWEAWGEVGGFSSKQAHVAMADPQVRRNLVDLISRAREQDEQAVLHLERALNR